MLDDSVDEALFAAKVVVQGGGFDTGPLADSTRRNRCPARLVHQLRGGKQEPIPGLTSTHSARHARSGIVASVADDLCVRYNRLYSKRSETPGVTVAAWRKG